MQGCCGATRRVGAQCRAQAEAPARASGAPPRPAGPRCAGLRAALARRRRAAALPSTAAAPAEAEPQTGAAGGQRGGGSSDALTPRDARLTLLLVPLAWGCYNPSLRLLYSFEQPPSPGEVSAARLSIALLPFLPTLLAGATALLLQQQQQMQPSAEPRPADADALTLQPDWRAVARASAELGLLNLAGTAGQAWGLQHTSAVHAGVLLASINVLVPSFAALAGERVRPTTWLACALVLAGVAVLNADPEAGEAVAEGAAAAAALLPPQSSGAVPPASPPPPLLSAGDASVLAAAVCYSLYTVRLGFASKALPSLPLSAGKTLVLALGCVAWGAAEHAAPSVLWPAAGGGGGGGDVAAAVVATAAAAAAAGAAAEDPAAARALAWALVAFSALVPGSAATWLQARGQSGVSSSEAQVILALTPLVSVSLAAGLLGETLGPNVFVAGALMLSATALCVAADAAAEGRLREPPGA